MVSQTVERSASSAVGEHLIDKIPDEGQEVSSFTSSGTVICDRLLARDAGSSTVLARLSYGVAVGDDFAAVLACERRLPDFSTIRADGGIRPA